MADYHNCLKRKRIEIRLNRSEVTTYLTSIDKMARVLQHEGTTAIKAEPRTEDDLHEAEPLNSTDPEVGVRRKGFQCPKCQLTFKYRLHLRHHQQDSNKRCAIQRSQTNDVKLNNHWKTQDKDTTNTNSNAQVKHSCPKCKMEFNRPGNLRRHMLAHTMNANNSKPYSCSTCLQRFKYEHNFNYHTRREHLFKCEHCELAFTFKLNLDRHITKCHRDQITNMGHSVNIEDCKYWRAGSQRMLPCTESKKLFTGLVNLQNHSVVHSNKSPYVCSKCLLSFTLEYNLNGHTQKEHPFKCMNCELSFVKKARVEAHVLKCHPEKISSKGYTIVTDHNANIGSADSASRPKHSCLECKKELSSFRSLQRHIKLIHSNDRPYVCSKCLQTFKSSANLDIHTRSEHRFQCMNCELSFLHKASLEGHKIKYHQPVSSQSFSCPECKMGFTTQGHLREHMKVHSKERLYVCSMCLHTFKHKNNLIGHTQKDHGFKCDQCMLVFICQNHLTQHLSQHTAEEEGT